MSIHVIPLNDEIEHCFSAECWCDPDVEWLDEETGMPLENGPKYIHFAHDGREIVEELTGECMDQDHKWGIFVEEFEEEE